MLSLKKLILNLVVFEFILVYFLSLDPLDTGFGSDDIPVLKHSISIISLVSIPVILLIRKFRTRVELNFRLLTIFFFLTIFGSIYTVLFIDSSLAESFVGRSLTVLIFLNNYILLQNLDLDDWQHLYSRISKIIIAFSIISSLLIFYYFFTDGLYIGDGSKMMFHTNIFLVSGAIILISEMHNMLLKIAMQTLIICATILITKNTTYIVLLIILLLPRLFVVERVKLKTIYRIFFITTILLLGYFYFILWQDNNVLPEGSTAVRYVTYSQRIDEFLQSPLWGTFFIGSPIITLAWLEIPSHSDLLDVLAFGGLASGLLLFLPVISALNNFPRKYFNRSINSKLPQYFYISIISWLIIMAFNAPWAYPRTIFFFWFSLALLIVLNNKDKSRWNKVK